MAQADAGIDLQGRGQLFRKIWNRVEASRAKPEAVREIVVMPYSDFERKVMYGDRDDAEEIVESLYSGDGFILKRAYDQTFWDDLKSKATAYAEENNESFNKIYDDCADFHRVVGNDLSGNYGAHRIRHDWHFHPWNGDPLGLMEEADKRWRVFKVMSGNSPDEYVGNKASDGIIDRYHIFHYPHGGGQIETHRDPTKNQKTIVIAFGSKRGVDYQSGGLYMVREDGTHLDCEPLIDQGDMGTCYANIHHGVETVDGGNELDWSPDKGRWFFGLYSVDSDYKKDRDTIVGVGGQKPGARTTS